MNVERCEKEEEDQKSLITMVSYSCKRHHRWGTQTAWTNNGQLLLQPPPEWRTQAAWTLISFLGTPKVYEGDRKYQKVFCFKFSF